jgi:hypothetical protein
MMSVNHTDRPTYEEIIGKDDEEYDSEEEEYKVI